MSRSQICPECGLEHAEINTEGQREETVLLLRAEKCGRVELAPGVTLLTRWCYCAEVGGENEALRAYDAPFFVFDGLQSVPVYDEEDLEGLFQ